MKILTDKNTTPPGGWRYEDPDTGYKFNRKYRFLGDLITHIRAYRTHNNLTSIHNLEAKVVDWICCQDNMERYCRDEQQVRRSMKDIAKGAVSVVKSLLTDEYVEQHIAEKRAKMCLNCPFNKYDRGDMAGKLYSDKFRLASTNNRSTPYDKELYTCEKCKCILPVKVHMTKEEVKKSLDRTTKTRLMRTFLGKDGKPFECWQMKDVY